MLGLTFTNNEILQTFDYGSNTTFESNTMYQRFSNTLAISVVNSSANVRIDAETISFKSNVYINSSSISLDSNVSVNNSLVVLKNSTTNVVINTSTVSINGNTSNVSVNTSLVSLKGNTANITVNTSTISVVGNTSNVSVNTSTVSIKNSSVTFTISLPNTSQVSDSNYFLNANNEWAVVNSQFLGGQAANVYVNTSVLSNTLNVYVNTSMLSSNLANYLKIVSVPANSTATGTAGQVSYDNTYFYVCFSNNNWIRISKDTW